MEKTSSKSYLPNYKRDKSLLKALSAIDDPELHIPITSMGLIYGATKKKDGTVEIIMTLTTIGCPLYDVIKNDIEEVLYALKDVTNVTIDLTFDPAWHPGMMDEDTQLELGIL